VKGAENCVVILKILQGQMFLLCVLKGLVDTRL